MGVASDMDGARRLTPVMRSRKLQALDFIKRYFASWSKSPTLGELAAELGVSPKRAHDLVHQLSNDRQLEVTGRTRGIRLRDPVDELSEADVLLRLRGLGWKVALDGRLVPPPGPIDLGYFSGDPNRANPGHPLMEKGLPDVAVLDIEPADEPPHTNPGAPAGDQSDHERQRHAGATAQDPRHADARAAGDRHAAGR